MAVPEDRQAGAQGVIGAAQALTAGVTAIVIGAVYDSYGRLAAYGSAGAGILAFACVGMALAWPHRPARGSTMTVSR
jgi:hypothetical protein